MKEKGVKGERDHSIALSIGNEAYRKKKKKKTDRQGGKSVGICEVGKFFFLLQLMKRE